MPNEEYQRSKKERERKDKKTSIMIFAAMVVSLVGGLVYIVVNR